MGTIELALQGQTYLERVISRGKNVKNRHVWERTRLKRAKYVLKKCKKQAIRPGFARKSNIHANFSFIRGPKLMIRVAKTSIRVNKSSLRGPKLVIRGPKLALRGYFSRFAAHSSHKMCDSRATSRASRVQFHTHRTFRAIRGLLRSIRAHVSLLRSSLVRTKLRFACYVACFARNFARFAAHSCAQIFASCPTHRTFRALRALNFAIRGALRSIRSALRALRRSLRLLRSLVRRNIRLLRSLIRANVCALRALTFAGFATHRTKVALRATFRALRSPSQVASQPVSGAGRKQE